MKRPIVIKINQLIGELKITGEFNDGVKKMEEEVTKVLLRVLNTANGMDEPEPKNECGCKIVVKRMEIDEQYEVTDKVKLKENLATFADSLPDFQKIRLFVRGLATISDQTV